MLRKTLVGLSRTEREWMTATAKRRGLKEWLERQGGRTKKVKKAFVADSVHSFDDLIASISLVGDARKVLGARVARYAMEPARSVALERFLELLCAFVSRTATNMVTPTAVECPPLSPDLLALQNAVTDDDLKLRDWLLKQVEAARENDDHFASRSNEAAALWNGTGPRKHRRKASVEEAVVEWVRRYGNPRSAARFEEMLSDVREGLPGNFANLVEQAYQSIADIGDENVDSELTERARVEWAKRCSSTLNSALSAAGAGVWTEWPLEGVPEGIVFAGFVANAHLDALRNGARVLKSFLRPRRKTR
jgi:hypothetical protein